VAIKISKTLRAALPETQRPGIEDYLWAKSGGLCHLCEQPMNLANDSIEADHDVPLAAGGQTDRDNLWLAHAACNRAKRDNPSVDVRPYLKIKAFMAKHGYRLKYDGILAHFKISPKPSKIEDQGETVVFHFPGGAVAKCPVFVDENAEKRQFRYVFVEVPRLALHNDMEVQPRSLKLSQLWAIYSDIQVNPLHEPPSCRLVSAAHSTQWLALFDGQHKTVASWMKGVGTVCAKVYLDLTKHEANYLVNSIQAKIKKLPLSPFELSAKLSEEWTARVDEYLKHVDADEVSEKSFVAWLQPAERARARSAFEAALIQELISANDLAITRFVHLAGQPKTAQTLITETQFSNKVLKRLLHTAPLDEPGDLGEELRVHERQNIISALNIFEELVFEPEGGGGELTEKESERRRRMLYQGSLSYISDLIKGLHEWVFAVEPDRGFLDKVPGLEQETMIRAGIERAVNHPVWTTKFDLSLKMNAVQDALSKNQDVEKAFSAVGLKRGYVVGADQLPNDWYK
jgi:hypothetical protein